MTLTRFDSNFFRGKEVVPTMSSYSAFTVGKKPGRLVMAGSLATQASLGSQIAAKMCLEHFSESILNCFEKKDAGVDNSSDNVLETSFRNANLAVYNFGHKLAAGGRLAAAIIALVIENGSILAGRVGNMGAYLYRRGGIFPFFLEQESADTCIGINSKVVVETAEVEAKPLDSVFFFSRLLSVEQEEALAKALGGIQGRVDFDLEKIVRTIFPDSEGLEFAQVICIGPETVFLSNQL